MDTLRNGAEVAKSNLGLRMYDSNYGVFTDPKCRLQPEGIGFGSA